MNTQNTKDNSQSDNKTDAFAAIVLVLTIVALVTFWVSNQ